LKALHATKPPSLTSSAKDVDPGVERVVLRCLERDPKERPANARVVLLSLPGGDPLQAAVLAGETPSPEMVAAAAKVGDLRPAVAWAYLLPALAGLVLVAHLAGTTTLIGRLRPGKAPEVLAERARELLATMGYTETPADTALGFDLDFEYLAYVARHDPSPNRWAGVATARPGPLVFWYRQGAEVIAARRFPLMGQLEVGRITREDPPPIAPGTVEVVLDHRGSLVSLRAVASPLEAAKPLREPDWPVLLSAAGLDASALVPVAPSWTAPVDSDRKAAWDGAYPGQPGVAIHVEAASLRGKPVWFEVHGPWVKAAPPAEGAMASIVSWTAAMFIGIVLAAIGWVVRRNLLMGRSDRRGGARLAACVSVCLTLGLMLRADHVASVRGEAALVMNLLALVLLNTAAIWAYYIAVEPIARRIWPQLLISWSRLLGGRFRDPLVGRDGLVGGLVGVVLALVIHLAIAAPPWLGLEPNPVRARVVTTLASSRHFGYFIAYGLCGSVAIALSVLFLWFLLRSVLRSSRLALGSLFTMLYVVFLAPPITSSSTLWSVTTLLFTAIWVCVLTRVGLLAAMASLFVFLLLDATPLTLELSAWYAGPALSCLALLAGLLIYCFVVALAGRPMFGHPFLEGEGA
jgi:serine/threonine-protein kinase